MDKNLVGAEETVIITVRRARGGAPLMSWVGVIFNGN